MAITNEPRTTWRRTRLARCCRRCLADVCRLVIWLLFDIGGLRPFSLNNLPQDLGVRKDSGFVAVLAGLDQISGLVLPLESSAKISLRFPKLINPFAPASFALKLQPSVKLIAAGTIGEQLASACAS